MGEGFLRKVQIGPSKSDTLNDIKEQESIVCIVFFNFYHITKTCPPAFPTQKLPKENQPNFFFFALAYMCHSWWSK